MRAYELVLVIKSGISETDRKKVLDIALKALGEAKTEVVEWGKKPLSYPIKKEREGFYYLFNVDYPDESAIPADFEKKLFANENILRHLFVRKSKTLNPKSQISTNDKNSKSKKFKN